MSTKTFSQIIGWKGVRQAANASIRIADSFTKYSVGGRTILDRLDHFSAAAYMNATDWSTATADFSWWQKNATALGLSFHLYWCNLRGGDYFTLRMPKNSLVSNIGNSPLTCDFMSTRYLFEEDPPQDDERFSICQLTKENFYVPMKRFHFRNGLTYDDIYKALLTDDDVDAAIGDKEILDSYQLMEEREKRLNKSVYRLIWCATALVECLNERSFTNPRAEERLIYYFQRTSLLDGQNIQTCICIRDSLGMMDDLFSFTELTVIQPRRDTYHLPCDERTTRALKLYIADLLNRCTR